MIILVGAPTSSCRNDDEICSPTTNNNNNYNKFSTF
jgi:hypothetical protein